MIAAKATGRYRHGAIAEDRAAAKSGRIAAEHTVRRAELTMYAAKDCPAAVAGKVLLNSPRMTVTFRLTRREDRAASAAPVSMKRLSTIANRPAFDCSACTRRVAVEDAAGHRRERILADQNGAAGPVGGVISEFTC